MTEEPSRPPGAPGDFVYGILNSIEKPAIGKSIEAYGNDTWSLIADATVEQFKNDAISNTGPYRGVVLRVEAGAEDPSKAAEGRPFSDPDDASHYIYGNDSTGGDPPLLVRIKVRIPELHAYLPVPSAYGDVDGVHHRWIDLYPTYTAQSDLTPQPLVGDIVWVDYSNKNDFTDPIYLRPVTEKQHYIKSFGKPGSGKGALKNCTRTSNNSPAVKLSDKTPAVNYAANQNYPQGTRTVPEGAETVIIEAGQSNGVIEPEAGIKKQLQKLSVGKKLKIKAWTGRLEGNGNRNVVVMMPLTTDLDSPFELIYHFHGAKSWFSLGTPLHLFDNMKTLSSSKRNFVLVYPQCPWGGAEGPYKSKVGQMGGSETAFFLGAPIGSSKGGNFERMHNQVLTVINETLRPKATSGALALSFLTLTCHSRGGIALATIAATGGFDNIKPDKITIGDGDYGGYMGSFNQRKKHLPSDFPLLTQRKNDAKSFLNSSQLVWEHYVSKAGKDVEFNMLIISPARKNDSSKPRANWPRKAAQKVILDVFGQTAGEKQVSFQKENNGGTASVTYVPYMDTHGGIGSRHAITFVGSSGRLPVGNKKDSDINPEAEGNLPSGEVNNEGPASESDIEESEAVAEQSSEQGEGASG